MCDDRNQVETNMATKRDVTTPDGEREAKKKKEMRVWMDGW